jgi:hypothetical protein
MGWLIAVVLIPVVLAEFGEVSPWLARRWVRWAARQLPTRGMRTRYAEEWRAHLEQVPGKVTKLGFAASLVVRSVPVMQWRTFVADRQYPGLRAACERAIASLRLPDTSGESLQAVADVACEVLGFRYTAVNLVEQGVMRCAAASGSIAIREDLVGDMCDWATVERLFQQGEPWGGGLWFIRDISPYSHDVKVHTPEMVEPDVSEVGVWRRHYELLIPLEAMDGKALGLLSLAAPRDGRFPGPVQRQLAEDYAGALAQELARHRAAQSSERKSSS